MGKTGKKFLAAFVLACLAASVCAAQGRIVTRKHRISDFTSKVTRVVLSGNEIFDLRFQEEISRRWRISPYEFCSRSEYEASKKNTDYYFLVPVNGQTKDETAPGIAFLSLEKGGEPGGSDPMKASLTILTFPYASASFPSGREFVFLPAIIDIIQDYTLQAMTSDVAGYAGLGGYAQRVRKNWDKDIYLSEDDLAEPLQPGSGLESYDEDAVDEAFAEGREDLLVGYVVAPSDPENGSWCYKMVISAGTHELYYFDRHKIGVRSPAGFLRSDLKQLSSSKKSAVR